MTDIILEKLKEIEKAENVKILYCIESGSRAWGFASPDSDYDVRFIYIRPMEYYLGFDKMRDVIEYEMNDTYDISGWDIQKAFSLLYKSNPTLFEWIQSPIVYYTTDAWKQASKICDEYFSEKDALYHYLNTVKYNLKSYLSDERFETKTYFYVLRSLLCCKWIMEYGKKPPMLFSDLCEKYLDGEIKYMVEELVKRKVSSNETEYCEHIEIIDEFIRSEISLVENYLSNIKREKTNSWDRINEMFITLLKESEF